MEIWREVQQLLPPPAIDEQVKRVGDDRLVATTSVLRSQIDWLSGTALQLARSEDARRRAFAHAGRQDDELEDVRVDAIQRLAAAWQIVVRNAAEARQSASIGGMEDDVDTQRHDEQSPAPSDFKRDDEDMGTLLIERAVLSTRILRNVVAGEAEGQKQCYHVVILPILDSLWTLTSFAFEGDERMQLLARTLVQLLCNLVTDNEMLQAHFWSQHLLAAQTGSTSTTSRSGADLVARLLASHDAATSLAASVLLVNLTSSSPERSTSLASSRRGTVLLHALLHLVQVRLAEDEEDEEREELEAAASDGDSALELPLQMSAVALQRKKQCIEGLGILYTFFTRLFDLGLLHSLWSSISPEPSSFEHDSIVSPSQITVLKLLDAYLHSIDVRQGGRGLLQSSTALLESLPCLAEYLASYALWARQAMEATLSSTASPVDVRLVEVHVALILLLQCLTNMMIATDATHEGTNGQGPLESVINLLRGDESVGRMLSLLHTTNAFSPAASPFVPKGAASASSGQVRPMDAPDGHALSSTGRAALSSAATESAPEPAQPRPRLDKLKRDLVALLSVLAYERQGPDGRRRDDAALQERQAVRHFQDRVREHGGLVDILNLTQLDENNPYIREHAIFGLRNLLKGNQASQDFIAQIRPMDPHVQQ